MIYRLIVLTGPESGRRITVGQTPMTIGSGSDCDIVVKDEEVARKHAVIEHSNEKGLIIRDLGSMHRVLVNQHEARECRLKHGDEIELGRTRFLVQATVRADVDGQELAGISEGIREKRPIAGVVAAILVLASAIGGVALWINRVQREESAVVREDERNDWRDIPESLATSAAVETTSPAITNSAPLVAAAGPSDNDRVSNELQRMQHELTGIREIVQVLAEKKPPAPDVAEPARGEPEKAPEPPPEIAAIESKAAAEQPPVIDLSRYEKAPPAPAKTPPPNSIKIVSVDQSKFPKSDDYEEMRALNIDLALDSVEPIDAGKVRVMVSFFDRNLKTGKIAPTKSAIPTVPMKINDGWEPGLQKFVTATYVVPKGKKTAGTAAARDGEFYGFVVRVFYADGLQDQTARPFELLNRAPAKLD